MRGVHEIVLDSEIGARRFYEHHGFVSKGPHRYVLATPGPDLLRAILVMAESCPDLPPRTAVELGDLVLKRIRVLRRRSRNDRDRALHAQVEAMAQTALSSCAHPGIATSATRGLLRCRRSLSDLEHLLAVASRNPEVRKAFMPGAAPTLGVVSDDRFSEHLESVFHLESPKRYQAIRSALDDPALAGKLTWIAPRAATAEELAWVHTPAYIERVAGTAGRPLTSLDIDTQTTERSYATACLAVGGCSIWWMPSGRPFRAGFAAVRPPGHHAEPGGHGVLSLQQCGPGACYLQHAHGLKRVMIVDIDAHHGNGAQATFYEPRSAMLLHPPVSLLSPAPVTTARWVRSGRGLQRKCAVGKGMGEADFLVILRLADPLARAYQPDLILVSCGFDLWLHDRLAEMRSRPRATGSRALVA